MTNLELKVLYVAEIVVQDNPVRLGSVEGICSLTLRGSK